MLQLVIVGEFFYFQFSRSRDEAVTSAERKVWERRIRKLQQTKKIELGTEQEFKELQDITYISSGSYGRLTEQEQQIYYKEFENKLHKIHSALN